jgi:hypothetical protein
MRDVDGERTEGQRQMQKAELFPQSQICLAELTIGEENSN